MNKKYVHKHVMWITWIIENKMRKFEFNKDVNNEMQL
jgi:hypothetical protein